MPEPTLALRRYQLAAKVGDFLGYGRGSEYSETAWTTRQQADIDDCIESGLRSFYWPASADGTIHQWSFLRPTATLTLASGADSVGLPYDFGGIEGDITLLDSGRVPLPVKLAGEGAIRNLYAQQPDATGHPELAAVVPLKVKGTKSGQRQELLVWPAADQEYTLELAYYLLPNALTDADPYAYGGAAHAETILEACLAVAELRKDDMLGPHDQKFRERLVASIAADRRLKPQSLGYNGDDSDGAGYRRRRVWPYATATWDGVEYE